MSASGLSSREGTYYTGQIPVSGQAEFDQVGNLTGYLTGSGSQRTYYSGNGLSGRVGFISPN